MTFDGREYARVRNVVLPISAAAWVLLLVNPGAVVPLCAAAGTTAMETSASLRMLLAMNRPVPLAASWALMLIAMMSPALIAPLIHVRRSSFAHRRVRSTALFVFGYAAVWMAAGGALAAAELTMRLWAPMSYVPAAALVIASVWQCSPVKQRCLNRCHAHPELAAFGAAADFDVLRFGMSHALWCAGSCWALMLLPMLLPRGHVLAMAAVALWIVGERLERPRPLSWRWRGCGKLIRMVAAQARMRRHAAQVGAPFARL